MSIQGFEITIEQYAGMCKGIYKTEPLDIVYACKDGQKRRIGFIARTEGATVLLIRFLKVDLREPIRKEVERLRMDERGLTTSKQIGSPPDPKLIKAYVKGDLKKQPKATVVVPDGVPAAEGDANE